jgi:chromosome segregation ATPase
MFGMFAVYFVRSIAHRMRSGHWLRSGGPFQAEIVDQVQNALADVEPLFQALADAEQRNIILDEALSDTNTFLEHLSEMLQESQTESEMLRVEREQLRARLGEQSDPSIGP